MPKGAMQLMMSRPVPQRMSLTLSANLLRPNRRPAHVAAMTPQMAQLEIESRINAQALPLRMALGWLMVGLGNADAITSMARMKPALMPNKNERTAKSAGSASEAHSSESSCRSRWLCSRRRVSLAQRARTHR